MTTYLPFVSTRREIICIQRIRKLTELNGKPTPWEYSFELKTHARNFVLLCPTAEERDLWVNGFKRILKVPIIDPNFVPMGVMTKNMLNLHEQVVMTEGNNVAASASAKQPLKKIESIEETKEDD